MRYESEARSALDLGFSRAQIAALLKKKGCDKEEIEDTLSAIGLGTARRSTFRTEYENALLDCIRYNGTITADDVSFIFSNVVEAYYPNGSEDPKASNTLKHADYYRNVYGSFATGKLKALADREPKTD